VAHQVSQPEGNDRRVWESLEVKDAIDRIAPDRAAQDAAVRAISFRKSTSDSAGESGGFHGLNRRQPASWELLVTRLKKSKAF
jgi:hypothetical protein